MRETAVSLSVDGLDWAWSPLSALVQWFRETEISKMVFFFFFGY